MVVLAVAVRLAGSTNMYDYAQLAALIKSAQQSDNPQVKRTGMGLESLLSPKNPTQPGGQPDQRENEADQAHKHESIADPDTHHVQNQHKNEIEDKFFDDVMPELLTQSASEQSRFGTIAAPKSKPMPLNKMSSCFQLARQKMALARKQSLLELARKRYNANHGKRNNSRKTPAKA